MQALSGVHSCARDSASWTSDGCEVSFEMPLCGMSAHKTRATFDHVRSVDSCDTRGDAEDETYDAPGDARGDARGEARGEAEGTRGDAHDMRGDLEGVPGEKDRTGVGEGESIGLEPAFGEDWHGEMRATGWNRIGDFGDFGED